MLINELPDECLLNIFNYLNDLDDLINSYKVCFKWSYLVTERTRKVKYLIESDPIDSFDCVYHVCNDEKKPIDGTVLSKLFGKLEIFGYSYDSRERFKREDIGELIRNQESVKGLIYFVSSLEESIAEYFNQLDMISTNFIEKSISQNGSSVKQLHVSNYTLDYFKIEAHNFLNLERLRIHNNESNPDGYYDGPLMQKLKVVELSLSSYGTSSTYFGFQFMDCCPILQSAHIEVSSDRLFVDESVKHGCLQDLVLDLFYDIEWDSLKRLFMKYPNLKHLALKGNFKIKSEQILQLVEILPNLILFDVRRCRGVTQRTAYYVQDYCKRHGRSIKFYFDGNRHEIESDCQLSAEKEKISRGFDFMKHCFLKHFLDLPVFLIPIDY